jgi:putative colanic acid biosynthesis acetyltransferase WcaF
MTHETFYLERFERPVLPGNRSRFVRVIWFLISIVLFQSRIPLLQSGWKAFVLRSFGAKVGNGLIIKPNVQIKYPWFLQLGDHVWLGERVWIDNPALVQIGSGTCVSQGAYIVTGNHDYHDHAFRYFGSPIFIGERVWVCAGAIVTPGSNVPPGSIVPIGSVWRGEALRKDLRPGSFA